LRLPIEATLFRIGMAWAIALSSLEFWHPWFHTAFRLTLLLAMLLHLRRYVRIEFRRPGETTRRPVPSDLPPYRQGLFFGAAFGAGAMTAYGAVVFSLRASDAWAQGDSVGGLAYAMAAIAAAIIGTLLVSWRRIWGEFPDRDEQERRRIARWGSA